MTRRPVAFLLLGWASVLPPPASTAQTVSVSVTARIVADPPSVFVREVFTLRLLIESVAVSLGKGLELHGLPDPSVLRMGKFEELPVQRQREGDAIRETRRFQCEAQALAPGRLNLAPSLRVSVLTRRRLFIGTTWAETPRTLQIEPMSLPVQPLPAAHRPESFSGAVGQFSFNVGVSPTNVVVGDLVTVTMRIAGKGDLDPIRPPSLSPGRHFKVYDPEPVLPAEAGGRTFRQILIPQSPDSRDFGPITFCYFDPRAGAYKSLARGPFSISFHARERTSFVPYRPRDTFAPRAEDAPDAADRSARELSRRLQDVRSRAPLELLLLAGYWALAAPAGLILAQWAFRRRRTRSASAGPSRRGPAWSIAGPVAFALLAGLAFLPYRAFVRTRLARTPYQTAVRSEEARIGPSHGALATFEVSAGSSVAVLDTHGSWAKIAHGSKRGWIPADAVRTATEPTRDRAP